MYEWWRFVIILGLIGLSGLFSGLTLGLLGLDTKNLELLTMGPFETKQDKRNAKYAKAIIPFRRRGNLLLCTLLLGNVAVNALLSILMADLTSGLVGFFVSTALIVVFGEIVPQSICSRYGLAIGYFTIPLVCVFMVMFFVVAQPIAMVLDCILGQELGNIFSKGQMKNLFEMYENDKLLQPEERKILTAALELQEKTAESVMTPIEKIYMLDINSKLDQELLQQIYLKGFSRIPVFEKTRENIVGILMARDLLIINPQDRVLTIRQLATFLIRDVIVVDTETKIEPIMREFKKGKGHIGIVRKAIDDGNRDPYYENAGVISLEDIIEEIIMDEIVDEDDIENEQNNGEKNGENYLDKKHKLVSIFTEKRARKLLSDEEVKAAQYYLKNEIPAFNEAIYDVRNLESLIKNSEVLHLRSDTVPLSHVIEDQLVKGNQGKVDGLSRLRRLNSSMRLLSHMQKSQLGRRLSQSFNEDGSIKLMQSEFMKNLKKSTKLNGSLLQQTLRSRRRRKEEEMKDPFSDDNTQYSTGDQITQDQIKLKVNFDNGNNPETNQQKDSVEDAPDADAEMDLESGVNHSHKSVSSDADRDRPLETGRGLMEEIKEEGEGDERNIEDLDDEELQILQESADNNPILYLRGHQTDMFYLIFQGRVSICSGKEGFISECGSFTVLGKQALTQEDYKPDFSAKVLGEAKVLRILREDYLHFKINMQ